MHLGFALVVEVPLGSEGDPGCTFFLLTHTKQLLLLTFCDTAADTEVSVRKHGRKRKQKQKRKRNGWTDGRGSRNSYLDSKKTGGVGGNRPPCPFLSNGPDAS